MKKEFVLFDFFFHFLFQIPSKETKQTKSKENFEQSNLFIFGIFVFKRKIRTKQAKNYLHLYLPGGAFIQELLYG